MKNYFSDFLRKPIVGTIGAFVGGLFVVLPILSLFWVPFYFIVLYTTGVGVSYAVFFYKGLVLLPFAFYCGTKYVQFHDGHGFGLKWLFKNLSKQLPKPIQRLSFLLFLLGIVIIILSILSVGYGRSYGSRELESFLTSVIWEPRLAFINHTLAWNQIWFYVGAILFVFGIANSFLYKNVFGKIYYWVRNG